MFEKLIKKSSRIKSWQTDSLIIFKYFNVQTIASFVPPILLDLPGKKTCYFYVNSEESCDLLFVQIIDNIEQIKIIKPPGKRMFASI